MRWWVGWLLLAACEGPKETSPDAQPADAAPDAQLAAPDPPPATVRYRLLWDLEGIDQSDDGLTFTNDFGHLVVIERGWLSSYSAQLVPCPEEGLGRTLLNLVIGTAHAGHSGEDDPSITPLGRVESLTEPAEITWADGPYLVETDRYCKAHYLVARAEPNTPGLPEAQRFVGQSLSLEGTVTPPGEAPVPFTFTTAQASGRIGGFVDAEGEPFSIDPDTTGLEVRFTRHLHTLLRGLDFVGMPPQLLELQAVYGLADAVRVEVTPYGP